MTPPTPPTTAERGTMLDPNATGMMPRAASAPGRGDDLSDIVEHVPDLVWPASLTVFDRMERSDAQISALMDSIRLPILRRRYELDPAGAADEDVRRIAEDLGVPVAGDTGPDPMRGRARFNHREHLEQALLALRYGSYWFEQVGEIVDGAWRLRKLAPRPTRTLEAIRVDASGGLVGITQHPPQGSRDPVLLDVGRIVGFVWKREGANWYGTSMLRAIYRASYYKDSALRADAVQKTRNSMGIPVFNPGADATPETITAYNNIGRRLQSGQEVSITLHAADASFTLQGVNGSLPNALESARYHDEDMSSAFLAMWMKLGQTQSGSRSLGDTLISVFNAALDTIADDWYCGTMNEYVIRDWMTFNYGENHTRPIPRLVSSRVESPELAIADLALAVEKGVIVADAPLRTWVRSNYNVPSEEVTDAPAPSGQSFGYDLVNPVVTIDERRAQLGMPPRTDGDGSLTIPEFNVKHSLGGTAPAPQVVTAQHAHEHIIHAGALDDGPTSRQRWRELTDREIRASIDPEGMDQRWRDAAARIVAAWPAVRREQIAALVKQIEVAGADYAALAALAAPTVGADIIASEMSAIAAAASKDAIREAAAQGAKITAVDLAAVETSIAVRAEATATLLAGDLARSAAGNAMRLMSGSSDPKTVAAEVAKTLTGLSDSGLAQRVVGALTSAQNEARAETIQQGPEPVLIVATEIMDGNTCDPCSNVDGTEYASMDEAEADYPDAGYSNCDGGDQCRGFVFAEYETNTGALA